MHRLFAFVLWMIASLLLLMSPGWAQSPEVCRGDDALSILQKNEPDKYAQMVARAEQIPNGNSLLWQIEKEGSAPSFLFGTYHSSSPDILQLLDSIESRLAHSSIAAFELIFPADPDESFKFLSRAMKLATLPHGINLKDYLTEGEEQKISRSGRRVGLYGLVPFLLKPGMLIMTLSITECDLELMKANNEFLDVKLQRTSESLNVPIVALETLEEQISALDGGSFEEQIKALQHFLTLTDRKENMSSALQRLYLEGRTDMLWAWSEVMSEDFLQEGQTFEEMMAPLLDHRNVKMADRSQPLIEAGGAFIAVGALHLPGKNGLVSLFRQQGYTVTAVH